MPMRNQSLAALFRSTATLLAGRGENPHRVRAYRRAADTIADLEADVGTIAEQGTLEALPGIGRELAAKIREFLATGRVQSLEALKTPLPPEVSSWATLPGFSESTVHFLFGALGIRTLEDLETLVRSHLLRTVPGVTLDEETLLAAIQARKREHSTR